MTLLFEMLGTGLVTMLFLATGGGVGMFIGYFVLLIMSFRISGAHYNPVVTFAFMMRKDAGKFDKHLGILYMLFQLGGAFLGCLLAYYAFGLRNTTVTVYEPYTYTP